MVSQTQAAVGVGHFGAHCCQYPCLSSSLLADTLYFFGDNNFTEWAPLFQHYRPPPFRLLGTTPAYSFGIAGAGSGVPFHWHGPGFSEVIYGRKVSARVGHEFGVCSP